MLRRALLKATLPCLLLASPARAWFPHGLPSDGFANGTYLPSIATVNQDISTSTPVVTGFTRGTSGATYTVTNSGGGSPYALATPTGSNSNTTFFTLTITAAGLALGPSAAFPFTCTIHASDGTTADITVTLMATGESVSMAGSNVISAGSASGPQFPFPINATLLQHDYTPGQISAGFDAPLPLNNFANYVSFTGNIDDFETDVGQARVNASIPALAAGTAYFVAGFSRPENTPTFGVQIGLGNQTNRDNGAIAYSLYSSALGNKGGAGNVFEFTVPSTFFPILTGPNEWNSPNAYQYALTQWQFSAIQFKADLTSKFWQDGVEVSSIANYIVPNAAGGALITTFGSWLAGDVHCYTGGLRNWVIVDGSYTSAELEAFRAGGNPLTIWSGRVWGYWAFTADPNLGQTEPDLSGNGHALTYYDLGVGAHHAKPYLATHGTPYLMDNSGLFEIVAASGNRWTIRTKSGVSSLSSIYGRYEVTIADGNGWRFQTSLFVVA